jgi:hypothetical protein
MRALLVALLCLTLGCATTKPARRQTLVIDCADPCRVTVDGKELTAAEVKALVLPEGVHEVLLEKPDKTVKLKVTVDAQGGSLVETVGGAAEPAESLPAT